MCTPFGLHVPWTPSKEASSDTQHLWKGGPHKLIYVLYHCHHYQQFSGQSVCTCVGRMWFCVQITSSITSPSTLINVLDFFLPSGSKNFRPLNQR